MAILGRPLVDIKESAAEAARRSLLYGVIRNGGVLERAAARQVAPFGRFVAGAFPHASDDRLLRSLMARHGVFAERFFAHRVRERVARRFARNVVDLEAYREASSDVGNAWGYTVREGGSPADMVQLVAGRLFEHAAIRVLTEEDSLTSLRAWAERHKPPRRCVLCGAVFSLLELPEWAYHGANGYKGCCLRCRMVQRPEPPRLMAMIPAFVSACGFVPTVEASPVCHAFTARLSHKSWPAVMRLWAAMGGTKHAKRLFGSWFQAMAASGALPDGVLATRKGIRCLAADGHACHSLEERRIDDFLHARRIPHQREPRYPAHRALNPSGARRADWRVGKTFLEYAGLAGDPEYDRKMDEKILLARHADMDLVVLYPPDLDRLPGRLGGLIGKGEHAC